MRLRRGILAVPIALWLLSTGDALVAQAGRPADDAPARGRSAHDDDPIAYWRFEESPDATTVSGSVASHRHRGEPHGVVLGRAGPRPPRHRGLQEANHAARFDGAGARIVIEDPGPGSVFDFSVGDSITIEAWVWPESLADGQQTYIIGKGRTGNRGVPRDNQNWSLRLRGVGGTCRVSFLFRDADNRPGSEEDWHRWTSARGFAVDSGWHHVAVTYTYGRAESVRGYVDGEPSGGAWDLGGASDEAPVVDDDEIWIGSSQGGSAGNSFTGRLDEVAVHRTALSAEAMRSRFDVDPSIPEPELAASIVEVELPESGVQAVIVEDILEANPFRLRGGASVTERFDLEAFAVDAVPRKYGPGGIIVDRSNPFLVQLSGRVELRGGTHRLLLRSFQTARLLVDGQAIAQTRRKRANADGHERVPDLPQASHQQLRPLPPGHAEKIVEVDLEPGWHTFVVQAMVGGRRLRPEVGELAVAIVEGGDAGGGPASLASTAAGEASGLTGAPLRLLGSGGRWTLSDAGWSRYASTLRERRREFQERRRRAASAEQDAYWDARHRAARQWVASLPPLKPPQVGTSTPGCNAIDRFIGARLESAGVSANPSVDDWGFARRSSLDVRGVVPSPQELEEYFDEPAEVRRRRWIDRMLESPDWADRWVSYWQDVLAENPGILKPKLNNSGPFRWFIHEAFLDNRAVDRFVTQLVRMRGSRYGGGPAGFAMATQNDVPMAAKAHVLGTAFLGVELKCARCHDAPYHPYRQEDLFSLAAMLARKPQKVPESSSIPGSPEDRKGLIVEVTLPPGSRVEPKWPFGDLLRGEIDTEELQKGDSRDRAAYWITAPQNLRFARVVANRLWKLYLGEGIVEPVHDWDGAEASHPQLLEFLARELVASDYDLKHLARLVLTSHVYARQATGDASRPSDPRERLFVGPSRRRLTAEQMVDSLFAVAGKRFGSEALNLDVDGRRPIEAFLNLGVPRRAWEFASLSNERDRPALAMPVAQSVIDLLKTFGWRESRQDPITVRETAPTPLQPLAVANGVVGNRIATLSDDSAFTRAAHVERPVEELVRAVFVRVLTRPPSAGELDVFSGLLREGYDERIVSAEDAAPGGVERGPRHAVSWSNHLSAEATRIKLELERRARQGDPPTSTLAPQWRERMEDFVWSLVNSPEFVFVP